MKDLSTMSKFKRNNKFLFSHFSCTIFYWQNCKPFSSNYLYTNYKFFIIFYARNCKPFSYNFFSQIANISMTSNYSILLYTSKRLIKLCGNSKINLSILFTVTTEIATGRWTKN